MIKEAFTKWLLDQPHGRLPAGEYNPHFRDGCKIGFEAGAKWAMEEAKKNEECLWCGYTAKNCDCTFTEGKFQESQL